ncbi:hypothetical protein BGZ63DRAFT_406800 [Mariannaea sp. PMI_226]|nr:hypothetical protein BGZ63DRAFT_406800 [Mariannaea sp. PMI_226]
MTRERGSWMGFQLAMLLLWKVANPESILAEQGNEEGRWIRGIDFSLAAWARDKNHARNKEQPQSKNKNGTPRFFGPHCAKNDRVEKKKKTEGDMKIRIIAPH